MLAAVRAYLRIVDHNTLCSTCYCILNILISTGLLQHKQERGMWCGALLNIYRRRSSSTLLYKTLHTSTSQLVISLFPSQTSLHIKLFSAFYYYDDLVVPAAAVYESLVAIAMFS